MDDTRLCPHCDGRIKTAARLCKHCREPVGPDLDEDDRRAVSRDRPRRASRWLRRTRIPHLIGVSVYAALGLAALTRVDAIVGLYGLVTSGIAIYLLTLLVTRALRLNDHRGADAVEGMADIVELTILALLLANVAGFWWGVSLAFDVRSGDLQELYLMSGISFSSTFFIASLMVITLGVTQAVYRLTSRSDEP